MANVKISQLPSLATLAGADVFPVVSGNATYNVTATEIASFVGSAATGSVTFDGVTVQGVNGLQLSADPIYTASLAYLQVRAGDVPSHVHLDTGDNAIYDLIVGDDSKYVQVGLGGNITIASNDIGTATQNIWNYDIDGSLKLATVNNESAQFIGTRKIVGGLSVASPYSVALAAGGTPTVAYSSSATSQSVRVTFAVQASGAGFNWEQFDVVATPSQDVAGTVVFAVSNRVKGNSTIPETVVTAAMNGNNIEISLTLDVSQTNGGASSFDAVEFGLMID